MVSIVVARSESSKDGQVSVWAGDDDSEDDEGSFFDGISRVRACLGFDCESGDSISTSSDIDFVFRWASFDQR